jgi:hypothetical protein
MVIRRVSIHMLLSQTTGIAKKETDFSNNTYLIIVLFKVTKVMK